MNPLPGGSIKICAQIQKGKQPEGAAFLFGIKGDENPGSISDAPRERAERSSIGMAELMRGAKRPVVPPRIQIKDGYFDRVTVLIVFA